MTFSFRLYNYDSAMGKLIGNIRNGILEHDELLSKIQTRKVSHGGATRQVTEPKVVETNMVNSKAIFEIEGKAILQTDVDQFTESIYKLFDSFHTEQKKYLLQVVSETTDAVGNTVDAAGKNFWDAYLEMIQKTEMTFDEHGNHNFELVMNPNTAKKLRENPPTEEQKQRIQEAIELKRKEYYERKPSRKLS